MIQQATPDAFDTQSAAAMSAGAPLVVAMQVIPVAGRDSMLLNLSGAHGPFFTRNIVIVTDSAGRRACSRDAAVDPKASLGPRCLPDSTLSSYVCSAPSSAQPRSID
jgi:hypothetical protein